MKCVPQYKNSKKHHTGYIGRRAENLCIGDRKEILFRAWGTVQTQRTLLFGRPQLLRGSRYVPASPTLKSRFPRHQVSLELGRGCGVYAVWWAFRCFIGIPQAVIKSFHIWSFWWFFPQGEMIKEVGTFLFSFFFFFTKVYCIKTCNIIFPGIYI